MELQERKTDARMTTCSRGSLDPREWTARGAEKTRVALRFLRDESWTTETVMRELLGLRHRQNAYRSLARLERQGFIRRHSLPLAAGRALTVWGITAQGLAHAFDLDEPHRLDLQKMRVRAEGAGWREWTADYLCGPLKGGANYPDAVAMRPDGARVAVEIERTVKSTKRYAALIVQHLLGRRNRRWDYIYYLSPTRDLARRVERIFGSIERIAHDGRQIALTPGHREPFRFFGYDDDWTAPQERREAAR
jgi:hypothetical protein